MIKCSTIIQIELEFRNVGFWGEGKSGVPRENLSEQSRDPTINSTKIWRRVWESNPGHIGGRRSLSPLHVQTRWSFKRFFERLQFRVGANPAQNTTSCKIWNKRACIQQGGVQLPFTFSSESKFNSTSLILILPVNAPNWRLPISPGLPWRWEDTYAASSSDELPYAFEKMWIHEL